MKSNVPPVSTWVRNTICVLGASAVPGMIVVSCFGATMNLAIASAVATFAVCSARLAFNNAGSEVPKANSSTRKNPKKQPRRKTCRR